MEMQNAFVHIRLLRSIVVVKGAHIQNVFIKNCFATKLYGKFQQSKQFFFIFGFLFCSL